jgi:hypothetical protein
MTKVTGPDVAARRGENVATVDLLPGIATEYRTCLPRQEQGRLDRGPSMGFSDWYLGREPKCRSLASEGAGDSR